MQDKRSEVVDEVLATNEKLLAERKISWPTARQSVSMILNDLIEQSPNHPSIERLRDFIARHDAESRTGKE